MHEKKLTISFFNSYRGRFILMMSLIAVVIVLFTVAVIRQPASPIPASIVSSVSFPIYYPNQNKLPSGYTLNPNSFEKVSSGVILFSVSYARNQNIAIVEQAMPASSVIARYAVDYIPLHNNINTPNGKAIYGAYDNGNGLKSVVSLEINGGPWLIATAPSSINRSDFIRVIDSLIKG